MKRYLFVKLYSLDRGIVQSAKPRVGSRMQRSNLRNDLILLVIRIFSSYIFILQLLHPIYYFFKDVLLLSNVDLYNLC